MRVGGERAIGVIGGSGLYELEGLTDVRWRRLRTPFGDPSDEYCVGTFEGRRVIFLPRHGRGHRLMPSELNFRANVWGLKALGAEWVVSVSAVGSMKEEIRPLDLVVPHQFYDATRRRVSTFFGDGIVAHVGMADPVCPLLAGDLEKAARATGATVHRGGTYLCIDGPQFSTKAESWIHRGWGVDVIGMTNMPEAKLAREAELCYATLALATDYDVWHDTHGVVTVEAVIRNLLKNVATAKDVLRRVIPALDTSRACECPSLLKDAVITSPAAFPLSTRRRLDLLLGKYFPTETRRTPTSSTRGRTAAGKNRRTVAGTRRGESRGGASPLSKQGESRGGASPLSKQGESRGGASPFSKQGESRGGGRG